MRERLGWMVLMAAAAAACGRSPQREHARHLAAARSWASAVAFAERRAAAGEVPAWYVRDTIAHAAEEVASLRRALADDARDTGTGPGDTAAADLADLLAGAVRSGRAPADTELLALSRQLQVTP